MAWLNHDKYLDTLKNAILSQIKEMYDAGLSEEDIYTLVFKAANSALYFGEVYHVLEEPSIQVGQKGG